MAFYDSETLFVFIVSFHLPLELLLINYLKKKKKMRGYLQFIFWDSHSHSKFLLFLYSHTLRKNNFL